ncbi:MAG: AAA family ATPase [Methylacidiphilales bacterium]|nr:AAA family ATPase [Candidatus Methylacidiphilales bacterium]
MNRLNREIEKNILIVIDYAQKSKHSVLTPEHLLLALLQVKAVKDFCTQKKIKISLCKIELKSYLESNVPKHLDSPSSELLKTPVPTNVTHRILQRVIEYSQTTNKQDYDSLFFLIILHDEKDTFASALMQKYKLGKAQLLKYFLSLQLEEVLTFPTQPKASSVRKNVVFHVLEEKKSKQEQSTIDSVLVNLNTLALNNKLPPLVGRVYELDRLTTILGRKHKNNPILVGDAGVGKTTLVHGLVHLITQNKAMPILNNSTVYSLQIGSLVAGTKYRGDFEKKMVEIMTFLNEKKNPILFIDEIHTIIGTGSTTGNTLDVANMLKPFLTSGSFRCIGATTYVEYRTIFEKDSALVRRFSKVDIKEPTVDESLEIIKGITKELSNFHSVIFSDEVIRLAIALSVRYIGDRKLPDKAIDILDEIGSKFRKSIKNEPLPFPITLDMVEEHVASITNIPKHSLTAPHLNKIELIVNELNNEIIGQQEAITKVTSALKRYYAGLRDPEKPIYQCIFLGPTGVGKTMLCRKLAEKLSMNFVRFDMSEFSEQHSVSRLIGSPPGYVGFDQGGQITEVIARKPHSIILLDEIEKSTPAVHQLFLQIMDRGVLSDQMGREISFKNCLIVFTSNLGFDLNANEIGFSSNTQNITQSFDRKSVTKLFPPEFLGRLDELIVFQSLGNQELEKIIKININNYLNRVVKKNYKFLIDASVIKCILEKVIEARAGSRPIDKFIESCISEPLADFLLSYNGKGNLEQNIITILYSGFGDRCSIKIPRELETTT